MSSPLSRWQNFCELRNAALARAMRTPCEVQVVAVSKYHSAAKIFEHISQVPGFTLDLGENYLQELGQKQAFEKLASLPIRWHFIGALQTRKIAAISSAVSCIHSVGRIKELDQIAKLRSQLSAAPDFYLQFNASGEGSKNGFEMGEAGQVLETLDRAKLMDKFLGVMCSAAPLEVAGETEVRKTFVRLRELRDRYFVGKKLNMGMSSDFALAIEEGSDLVRVGTLLFGDRN
jgi:PLP dependent protein